MPWPGLCCAQLSQATCSEISPWHSQAALALPHPAGWINTGFGLDKEQAFLHQTPKQNQEHPAGPAFVSRTPAGWAGQGQKQLTRQAVTLHRQHRLPAPHPEDTHRGLMVPRNDSDQLQPQHTACSSSRESKGGKQTTSHQTVGMKSLVLPEEAKSAPGNAPGPEQGGGVWENPPWSPAGGPPAVSGSCCGRRNISF